MYQALYRKYRSQTFDEMVGQSVVSTTLKQAVSSKKISHAYLFQDLGELEKQVLLKYLQKR